MCSDIIHSGQGHIHWGRVTPLHSWELGDELHHMVLLTTALLVLQRVNFVIDAYRNALKASEHGKL